MSRSGYSDDCDGWDLIRWRGAVKSAIRGKRGQAFLVELRDSLDALPEKKLCAVDLQRKDGSCCAIGAVGKARGIDMTEMDGEYMTDTGELAEMFNIAGALVKEIEYENDECDDFWYEENIYDERGFPVYIRDRQNKRIPLYKYNDKGDPLNKNGLTKLQFESQIDELRFSRVRKWVDNQIREKTNSRKNEKTNKKTK